MRPSVASFDGSITVRGERTARRLLSVGGDRPMIAALVLAAGESSRMGGPAKQLLPYRGSTVLGTVVESALSSTADDVLVVTGFWADEVERLLPPDVVVVRNPDPSRGNHSSLETGLTVCGGADAVVLLLGDQPEVDAEIIDMLIEAWRASPHWAAVPEYRGEPSHPFLLSAECVAEVGTLEGPRPLWRWIVGDEMGRVLRVPVDRPLPIDVDTPDDYRKLTEER